VASEGTPASGLATRYAAALFDLATENKKLDQTARDLSALKEVLSQSPELRRFISSPVLTRAQQTKGLNVLLETCGISDLVQRFVRLVAQKRRLQALPDMIDAYLADIARRRGEVKADVTVALPLSETQGETLTKVVREAVGDNVVIKVTVDPDLLGGMVVKVGSRMVDNSLLTKIDKLQLAMKAPGGHL
jgi:F-type H+-transporting ATPase subunit delta